MKSIVQYLVTRILLYGNESFKNEVNLLIVNISIGFALSANRFDEPLIFSGLMTIFLFVHNYMATTLQFLKF